MSSRVAVSQTLTFQFAKSHQATPSQSPITSHPLKMQFTKKLAIVVAAVALVSSTHAVAAVDVVESSCKCVALDESSPVLSTIDANATAKYFPRECQADGEEGATYLCTFEQAGPKEGFIGWLCRKFSKNWSCGFL